MRPLSFSLLLAAVAAVRYWRWALSLPAQEGRSVRWLIGSSVFWGPCLGLAVFVGALLVTGWLVGRFGQSWR